jgi:hypothetical protein
MSVQLPPISNDNEQLCLLHRMAEELQVDIDDPEPTVDQIERILDGLRWNLNWGMKVIQAIAKILQEPMADGDTLRATFGVLTPGDLATLTGKDERTLAVWRGRNCGPDYVKLGRAVFYRREDVQAWIALNVMPADRAVA